MSLGFKDNEPAMAGSGGISAADYGYYWFRHHTDASTFIAVRDTTDGRWYMPAVGHPIRDIEKNATRLGRVPRFVVGGGSIDQ